MRINANLEPTYLAPPSAQGPSALRQMSLYTGALDHPPPALELNLLGERLVLQAYVQGSCGFLALLMVNICLYLFRSILLINFIGSLEVFFCKKL